MPTRAARSTPSTLEQTEETTHTHGAAYPGEAAKEYRRRWYLAKGPNLEPHNVYTVDYTATQKPRAYISLSVLS